MSPDIDPPTAVVILPCRDEETYLPSLLEALLPQVESMPGWRLVIADAASIDTSAAILDAAARRSPRLTVLHGGFATPGDARSAAAAAVTVLGSGPRPDWLVHTSCDVEHPSDWSAGWARRLAQVADQDHIGALNGGEEQGHLLDGLPNAQRVSAMFGVAASRAENAVGIVNLNGANHAVRTGAYLECGPYVQPTLQGPKGTVALAGEDWDLGARLRLAGYEIAECGVSVRDRGRRLPADLHAYVSGDNHEGVRRVRLPGTTPPVDLSSVEAAELTERTIERALMHYLLKVLMICPALLDEPIGLADETVTAMRAWIERWPSPTFAESRNGFIHGRLPRFAEVFMPDVRRQFGLSPRVVSEPTALEG